MGEFYAFPFVSEKASSALEERGRGGDGGWEGAGLSVVVGVRGNGHGDTVYLICVYKMCYTHMQVYIHAHTLPYLHSPYLETRIQSSTLALTRCTCTPDAVHIHNSLPETGTVRQINRYTDRALHLHAHITA